MLLFRRPHTWLLTSLAAAQILASACSSDSSTADAGSASLTDAASFADAASAADAASTAQLDSGSSDAGAIAGDTTAAVVAAAEAFLATLDAAQQTTAGGAFDDASARSHWSNFPTGIFARTGLKIGVMSTAQVDAGFALLATILSPKGYQQITDTVAADEVLKNTSGGGNLTFGRAEYFFRILGAPSPTTPWMVQFGGHHLAINATIVGNSITLAPSLTGAQPATFTADGVLHRVQGLELDRARALMNALTASQKTTAVIGGSVIDLVLGPGQDGRVLAPEGLPGSELDEAQRALLLALIEERVGLLNSEDAAPRMALLSTELADTYFAWSGPTTAGSAAYYRVTGPSILIEYSPQSLGGNALEHTHAMYREPGNDYAEALR